MTSALKDADGLDRGAARRMIAFVLGLFEKIRSARR